MKKQKVKPTELDICKQQLEQAHRQIAELKAELKSHTLRNRTTPHVIDGWSIQFSGGYYRMFRRINGKLHGIYLGKKLDEELAREKIKRKMEDL